MLVSKVRGLFTCFLALVVMFLTAINAYANLSEKHIIVGGIENVRIDEEDFGRGHVVKFIEFRGIF